MSSQAIRPQGPNPEHWEQLQRGVAHWNAWRAATPDVQPDLSAAKLEGAQLAGINFTHTRLLDADLSNACLTDADLTDAWVERCIFNGARWGHAQFKGVVGAAARFWECDLRQCFFEGCHLTDCHFDRADLRGATLRRSVLTGSSFNHAQLSDADLSGCTLDRVSWVDVQADRIKLQEASLMDATINGGTMQGARAAGSQWTGARILQTDLNGADLRGANLMMASLVGVSLCRADISGALVFGTSAWHLDLQDAVQHDLCITPPQALQVTCDDLETAQFIYLLLHNAKLRQVIDTVGRKTVLLLGRFTAERKAVLDALRSALRDKGWVPLLFDFEQPARRDITETVSMLAHLSRFVIADLTDPRSIPQELKHIVPALPSVPVQPLLLDTQDAYSMFADLGGFATVLPPARYRDLPHLLQILDSEVLAPAEACLADIALRRQTFEARLRAR